MSQMIPTRMMSNIFSILVLVILLVQVMLLLSPVTSQNSSSSSNLIPPGRGGEWQLLQRSIGISPIHMQLLRSDKVVMFDRTDFGPSNLSLPNGRCRDDNQDMALKHDCTAHSVMYDFRHNWFRPLMVQTDVWCSSGSVLPNGTLLQTGGFNDGGRVMRMVDPSDRNCDWVEFPGYLSVHRWYASNQILPDGRVIVIGGRGQFSYEFYPKTTGDSQVMLSFLRETTDGEENNLYPFVHLLPDGNLFLFANTRAICLDYKRNSVVREYPPIPGGHPRNYPSTGSSVLLPIDANKHMFVEIMICGGAPLGSYNRGNRGDFVAALQTCGRIEVTHPNPSWEMEEMPMRRVLGDMLILPTGDLIIINGAGRGAAGWENAVDPVYRPVIYKRDAAGGSRFSTMNPTSLPRLYHSCAVLLRDGRVLVGGSNPHVGYSFVGVEYPTELSLEAFSPPYLARENRRIRPRIANISDNILSYRKRLSVVFYVPRYRRGSGVTVRLVTPSFTTHAFSMNQRMLILKLLGIGFESSSRIRVNVVAPQSKEVAPPGYYMLFVVHAGIPSPGAWVKLQ